MKIDKVRQLLDQYSVSKLADYIWVSTQRIYDWKYEYEEVPKKYRKRIVEFFERNNDTVVEEFSDVEM